jgi:hypothetical protein
MSANPPEEIGAVDARLLELTENKQWRSCEGVLKGGGAFSDDYALEMMVMQGADQLRGRR